MCGVPRASGVIVQVCYPSGTVLSRRLVVSWLSLFAVSASVCVSASGADAAEAKTSSLSWLRMPGADGCVATQPLARAIEERLGRSVFVSAAQADLSVEGRIEKHARGGGWHAVITVRDSAGATLGTRELDRPDASCDVMTEPLALIVAVMIDPDAAMRPRPPPTTDTPPPPPPVPASTASSSQSSSAQDPTLPPVTSATIDQPPKTPPSTPSKIEPWRFEGDGAITVNHGLTPSLAAGAGVEAILYPPKIPVGFRGYTMLFLPTSAERDGARATFDMLYAGGALCPTLRGRVNLLGCLGGQLGILRPRAETSNRGISENLLPIWNAMVELRLHIPITAPIGVAAGVGAGIPILRPKLDFTTTSNTIDTLHRADAFVLTADLAAGFFFP